MITTDEFQARLAIARENVAKTYLALDNETPGLHFKHLRAKIEGLRSAERLAAGGCFQTADRLLRQAFGGGA